MGRKNMYMQKSKKNKYMYIHIFDMYLHVCVDICIHTCIQYTYGRRPFWGLLGCHPQGPIGLYPQEQITTTYTCNRIMKYQLSLISQPGHFLMMNPCITTCAFRRSILSFVYSSYLCVSFIVSVQNVHFSSLLRSCINPLLFPYQRAFCKCMHYPCGLAQMLPCSLVDS